MKRSKESPIIMSVVAAIFVAGCSKPVLDYRNADVTDGLIYAQGANEPFTGTVTHVDDSFLFNNAPGYNKFMQTAGGVGYAVGRLMQAVLGNGSPQFLCTVSVRKGYVDGAATCYLPRSDTKIIEMSFDDGQLSGDFVYYNPGKPDQALMKGSFNQGQPDGTEKIYSASTGKLIKKVAWSDGTANGDYATYDETSGNVIVEGAYVNGKQQGSWKQYVAGRRQLIGEDHFDRGQANGLSERFDPDTGKRTVLVNKWVEGRIDGERKTWDKNGILLTDEVYIDGKKVADKDVKEASLTDSESLDGRMRQALSTPVTISSSPESATGTSGLATTSHLTTDSSASPISLDKCVKDWTNAYHMETAKAGVDNAISMDQINEWKEWCKAGKQPPAI